MSNKKRATGARSQSRPSVGKETDEILSVDLDSLTIKEISLIEDIIDAPIDDLAKPGMRRGRMMLALALVVKRRKNPDFSLEDAENLEISLKRTKANPPVLSA